MRGNFHGIDDHFTRRIATYDQRAFFGIKRTTHACMEQSQFKDWFHGEEKIEKTVMEFSLFFGSSKNQ